MRKLGAELRKSQPDVYRAVKRAVLVEAKIIAEDAKGRAEWSTRIPGTVKASTSQGLTAHVYAGGKDAPHAKPYEHAGRAGNFRHPVHGSPTKTRDQWTWVSEPARPFLHPAAFVRLPETVKAIGAAVVAAADVVIKRGSR